MRACCLLGATLYALTLLLYCFFVFNIYFTVTLTLQVLHSQTQFELSYGAFIFITLKLYLIRLVTSFPPPVRPPASI